jgi:hypothetical protein
VIERPVGGVINPSANGGEIALRQSGNREEKQTECGPHGLAIIWCRNLAINNMK